MTVLLLGLALVWASGVLFALALAKASARGDDMTERARRDP